MKRERMAWRSWRACDRKRELVEDWQLRIDVDYEQDSGCLQLILFSGRVQVAHLLANIHDGTVENIKTEPGHRRRGHCLRLHREAAKRLREQHGVTMRSDPPARRSEDCEAFYRAQVEAGRAHYDVETQRYVWTEESK